MKWNEMLSFIPNMNYEDDNAVGSVVLKMNRQWTRLKTFSGSQINTQHLMGLGVNVIKKHWNISNFHLFHCQSIWRSSGSDVFIYVLLFIIHSFLAFQRKFTITFHEKPYQHFHSKFCIKFKSFHKFMQIWFIYNFTD